MFPHHGFLAKSMQNERERLWKESKTIAISMKEVILLDMVIHFYFVFIFLFFIILLLLVVFFPRFLILVNQSAVAAARGQPKKFRPSRTLTAEGRKTIESRLLVF